MTRYRRWRLGAELPIGAVGLSRGVVAEDRWCGAILFGSVEAGQPIAEATAWQPFPDASDGR